MLLGEEKEEPRVRKPKVKMLEDSGVVQLVTAPPRMEISIMKSKKGNRWIIIPDNLTKRVLLREIL